jgi:hypothetical protein
LSPPGSPLHRRNGVEDAFLQGREGRPVREAGTISSQSGLLQKLKELGPWPLECRLGLCHEPVPVPQPAPLSGGGSPGRRDMVRLPAR